MEYIGIFSCLVFVVSLRYGKDDGVAWRLIKSARKTIRVKETFLCYRCGFGYGRGGGWRSRSDSTSGSGQQYCVCHMRRSCHRQALRCRILWRLQGLFPAIRQKESSVYVQVSYHYLYFCDDKYIQNILLYMSVSREYYNETVPWKKKHLFFIFLF